MRATTSSHDRRRRRRRLLLDLLMLSLVVSATVGAAAVGLPTSPRCPAAARRHHGDTYIAQLQTYGPLRDHEATVGALLGPPLAALAGDRIGVEMLPRPSVIARAPTDFVLVRLFHCEPPPLPSSSSPPASWATTIIGLEAPAAGRCHRAEAAMAQWLQRPGDLGARVRRVQVDRAYRRVSLLEATTIRSETTTTPQPLTSGPSSPSTSSSATSYPSHSATTRNSPPSVSPLPDELGIRALWARGFRGEGVRIGVFDTGAARGRRLGNVRQRINWTNERKTDDVVGHGTFVASIIGGGEPACPGLAPGAELFIFRTFTADQLSFTSWFLDAFNYALHVGVHVLNLSTGGPDFHDRPFVDKIQELAANGVIVVSAVGNNGPKYGTLTNPADQLEVIGVGGVDRAGDVAAFSSRGMTTWEFPFGAGRIKPDLVALAEDIPGAAVARGCKRLSGTSFAAPIVTGAIAVLASMIPDPAARWQLLNPAAVKQLLLDTADRLPARALPGEFTVRNHAFEQGAGRLNVTRAAERLEQWSAEPRNLSISAFPRAIDATDCPYMWPLCSQPLFHTSLPLMVNLTVLNPASVAATLQDRPRWIPDDPHGAHLNVSVASPEALWPFVGSVGVFIDVKAAARAFNGTASGSLVFTVRNDDDARIETLVVPVRVPIVPTPPKAARVLWDQFHNLPYPSAFVPRDHLESPEDLLDGAGDHPHTNFHQLWNYLRARGYYVDILPFEFSCLDLTRYGVVLLVDPEEEFFPEEVAALQRAVRYDNVSLLVFADWYDERLLERMDMFDTSTLSHWRPVTGGANVPALNDLLGDFHIEFGERVWSSDNVSLLTATGEGAFPYWSGTYLTQFPVGGLLGHIDAVDPSRVSPGGNHSASSLVPGADATARIPVLGLYALPSKRGGRIAVFGDSSCLDTSVHPTAAGFRHCFPMLERLLAFTNHGVLPRDPALVALTAEYGRGTTPPPARANLELRGAPEPTPGSPPARTTRLEKHSKVLRALQQRPARREFCHFHRQDACHEELPNTRVTIQVLE